MNDALPIELDAPPMRDERLIEIERLLALAKFNDDEIKRFAEVVLDEHIEELTDRVKDGETECRHLREALAHNTMELTDEMNTRIAFAGEADTLRTDLKARDKKISELEGFAITYRHQVKMLESQLANKQVPSPELEGIADYLAGIRPDKNCRTPGCFGMRGYSGFTTDIDVKTGHRKITVNLCCGKVGDTEYARILKKLEQSTSTHLGAYTAIMQHMDMLKHHLLLAIIHRAWLRLKERFTKKETTDGKA